MAARRSSEELEMRALVVPELRKRYPAARIIHELPLRYSTNRIDLAAVTETEIVSVEIKSSKDVIDRLEAQLRAFVPISARMIVALAPKWNEKLAVKEVRKPGYVLYQQQYTEAQSVIRSVSRGIEIWSVDAAARTVEKTESGYHRDVRPWLSQMLHMLHVSELKWMAERHQILVGKRSTHESLVEDLSDLLTGREIKRGVCEALRSRDAFCDGTDAPIFVSGALAA